jgi:hypothetical protein
MKPYILSNILFNYALAYQDPRVLLTFVVSVPGPDGTVVSVYCDDNNIPQVPTTICHKNELLSIIQRKKTGKDIGVRVAINSFKLDTSIHKSERLLRGWDITKTNRRTVLAQIYFINNDHVFSTNSICEEEGSMTFDNGTLVDIDE